MDGASDIDKPLYERDFLEWSRVQASALRARDFDAVDWANVIEEIETLGRTERRSLRSAIRDILEHRIKIDHGLNRDPERGWQQTITNQRGDAETILSDNPSLRGEVLSVIDEEYVRARRDAIASFNRYEPDRLDHYEAVIPTTNLYSEADILG